MTSTKQKLINARQKMVDNLTTRGVTADTTMTIDTLADKILLATPIPTNILLETDKTELNTVSDPTAVLTATVTDVNGSPVEGASVEFFANNTSLSSSITTNSSGKCSFSYTSKSHGSFVISCKSVNGKSNAVTITSNFIADIYVSPNGNDSNDGKSIDKAVATVEKAISLVNSGGVVGILNGIYPIYYDIKTDVTINGESKENTIISYKNNYNILLIDAKVIINNLTFKYSDTAMASTTYKVFSSWNSLTCNDIIYFNFTYVHSSFSGSSLTTTNNIIKCQTSY